MSKLALVCLTVFAIATEKYAAEYWAIVLQLELLKLKYEERAPIERPHLHLPLSPENEEGGHL